MRWVSLLVVMLGCVSSPPMAPLQDVRVGDAESQPVETGPPERPMVCGMPADMCRSRPVDGQPLADKSTPAIITLAEELLAAGKHNRIIPLLSPLSLRPGISQSHKMDVYRLLAAAYLGLDCLIEAEGAIRGLLVFDEHYELSIDSPQRLKDFFECIRHNWIDEGA